MQILDILLWLVAIFSVLQGVFLLASPKKALTPTIKKQLLKKGNENPTDQEMDEKVKQFRLWGLLSLVAGALLLYLLLTGGVFAPL